MSKKKAFYIDMDGTLARFHDADKQFIEAMWTPGFYVNLKPFENVCEAVRTFIKKHPDVDVYLLSAVLDTDPPFVVDEKMAWLDKYLPEIDKEHRIFSRAGEDKSQYIRMDCQCYLMDDYNKNLYEFEAAGNIGIKLRNDVNHKGLGEFGGSKGALWEGALVNYDDKPQKLCRDLEEIIFGRTLHDVENEIDLELDEKLDDFLIVDGVLVEYRGTNEYVRIPDGVEYIGDEAFRKAQFVKHVEFPDTLKSIRFGAFEGTDLQALNLPDGLEAIHKYAFAGCNSLRSVDIPESVRNLHYQAFADCENLKAINIKDEFYISDYSSVGEVVYSSNDGVETCLYCCPAGYEGELVLSEHLHGIGMHALQNCSKLTDIRFNDDLKIIGWGALSGCTSLKEVNFPASVTHLLDNALENCSSLERVALPDNLVKFGSGVFLGCKNLSKLVVSDEALVRYCDEFNLLDEVFMTPCYESVKARYDALIKGVSLDNVLDNARKRVENASCKNEPVEKTLE